MCVPSVEIIVLPVIWFATPAAITSIQIIPSSGGSGFATYTSFALYGIKAG